MPAKRPQMHNPKQTAELRKRLSDERREPVRTKTPALRRTPRRM